MKCDNSENRIRQNWENYIFVVKENYNEEVKPIDVHSSERKQRKLRDDCPADFSKGRRKLKNVTKEDSQWFFKLLSLSGGPDICFATNILSKPYLKKICPRYLLENEN